MAYELASLHALVPSCLGPFAYAEGASFLEVGVASCPCLRLVPYQSVEVFVYAYLLETWGEVPCQSEVQVPCQGAYVVQT